jgi:ammonium transporter Rh
MFHVHDTCGVQNLHGIPGFLGGILSAIVIASYNGQSVNDIYRPYLPFAQQINVNGRTYTQQAAIQVAGTFMSLGIGAFSGIIAGIIITCIYKTKC